MFQQLIRSLILALSASSFAAVPAAAAPFTAFYDFGGPATVGDIFSFDLEGTVNNDNMNLIGNVSSLSNFQLNGVPVFDPNDPGIFGGPFSVILDVLSFDGTANSFIATNPIATDVLAFQSGFGAVVQSNAVFGPSGFSVSETFDATRWSITALATVSEPTPLTHLIVSGLVLLGGRQLRRVGSSSI
ncbi:MAG: hypothetical protein AAFY29_18045 [Pseudomonadota bacterium]